MSEGKTTRKVAQFRIRVITVGVMFLLTVLMVRLYYVQVHHGDRYREEGESQYVHTVQDLFTRGSIYFTTRDGEKVSGGTIKTGYLLAINPQRIQDPQKVYESLSQHVSFDHDSFVTHASNKNKTYQEIVRQVDREVGEKIIELKLEGVHLYKNQWRYYPGKTLAARTIGFVGYHEDTLLGKYGLERYYEDVLKRDKERLSVNFFAEIFSNIGNVIFDTEKEKAGNIVTTIEPTVARTLDRVLNQAQEHWQSTVTGGIIIDPMTGEILALNVVPSYDLNERSGVNIESFRNPLIEDVYEFGSIIKPLTVASGLDAGVITPASTYYDAGFIELSDYTIRNFDGKGRGTVSMQEVLSQSLNTGVAHVVSLLGKERFRDYFYGLKIGSETGVDLPNEAYGLVANLESPRELEYVTASFGQGIALTPIGTVRALSALANGGNLITPHIVKQIEFENGKTHTIQFPPPTPVFKTSSSEDITRMLVAVVDTALKHGTVKNEHYSIAAKTGTAQIPDKVSGGYEEDRFLHSFFGYFPAYEPRFLIFLYTVDPKGVQYASETLTDPFMEIVQFLINYYALPPDR